MKILMMLSTRLPFEYCNHVSDGSVQFVVRTRNRETTVLRQEEQPDNGFQTSAESFPPRCVRIDPNMQFH